MVNKKGTSISIGMVIRVSAILLLGVILALIIWGIMSNAFR